MLTLTHKHITAFLLFFFLLLLGSASAYTNENSFRLFTTVEQRQTLETIRASNKPTSVSNKSKKIIADQSIHNNTIELKGYIQRSNGQNSVWFMHNKLNFSQANGQSIQIINYGKHSNSVRYQLPDSKTDIYLKPGQSYKVNEKQIQENFNLKSYTIDKINLYHK